VQQAKPNRSHLNSTESGPEPDPIDRWQPCRRM